MALKAPCLPLNPRRLQAFGRKGSEGLKTQIPNNHEELLPIRKMKGSEFKVVKMGPMTAR